MSLPARDFRRSRHQRYDPASASSDADAVAQDWEKNYLARSASDWRPSVVAALRIIRAECAVANWDGEDAVAISGQVISVAGNVLAALFDWLPKGTPMPDVLPEADGEICISWIVDAKHMFSLSLGDHGKVNFAGQFGKGGSVNAWQPIDVSSPGALGKSLEDVVRYVERLFEAPVERRGAERARQQLRVP